MKEPLSQAEARKLLSNILRSGLVRWSSHAIREMANDQISKALAVSILQFGRIWEPAEFENDSWRYRVHRESICIVVSFDSETQAVVVTTFRRKKS